MRVGEPVVGTGRLLRVSHMARPIGCIHARRHKKTACAAVSAYLNRVAKLESRY